MNEIKLIEGNLDDLRLIYGLFQRDFAPEELKDFGQLERLVAMGKYKLLLAYHKHFEELIGYSCIYEIEEINALWLDYIAVDIKFRNSGYGSALFNSIASYKQEDDFLGVFLEVEIPGEEDEAEQEIQKRRIRFYEKNGAARVGIDYELPTKDGSLPMYLYFRAVGNQSMLTEAKIRQAITSAMAYIHTDIPHTNDIIRKVVKTIKQG
ncbi:hypothetical protein DRW41_15570 [Neobacillus piezotolerans]|uniref:N-acetyltransferase domain-containing protein n=1 Tax=Neobacillus piezotolerans TaxID=2259171 RepID=A0A3D8GPL1_9BACI|nr:GNAT family N-acetyltransferase [Neobacillus piezotolerans]RDU36006.1 hypothetical protein DRW41_15570 [Neobacillus piezotolerans]